ncbi:hypothetical protein EVAR_13713_1 [Eumeta japonica]|uniref:Uncharacterized protein n=1 Tax=Eumeta variegata TaxID=151549 RepID=A0A4C1UCU7_EUMVA|nr:hypothetical protein EVAR_13713_1 [Eumeta japonica]
MPVALAMTNDFISDSTLRRQIRKEAVTTISQCGANAQIIKVKSMIVKAPCEIAFADTAEGDRGLPKESSSSSELWSLALVCNCQRTDESETPLCHAKLFFITENHLDTSSAGHLIGKNQNNFDRKGIKDYHAMCSIYIKSLELIFKSLDEKTWNVQQEIQGSTAYCTLHITVYRKQASNNEFPLDDTVTQ